MKHTRPLTLAALVLLAPACTQPSDPLTLDRREWVCTQQRVVSIKPFVQTCVQYSRLA